MQPIIARPHPKPTGQEKLEIVAGERRWRAALEAGLIDVPVIVREIADADLLQFQLTENLQRKTIDQLGEAEGYAELRTLKKITADQVADLLGVSRSTVFNRLKLLDLCPEARKALEEGKLAQSNAMLIARIGHHDTQRRVLKESFDNYDGPMTYRDLQEHIAEHYMVDLKGAPFKLDDEALAPKAGSCAKCPKRSGNQKDLFADVKNPNVCTDPVCYDSKRQIIFHKAAQELEAKGKKVIAGVAARKLMPYIGNGNDSIQGGYTRLSEKHYGSSGTMYGKTVEQILGPDFKPTLIQHPGSGKIIQVASTQAIAAALSGKKPKEEKPDTPRPRSIAPKLNMPDLDDQVTERLVQLIAEKAPKKFTRTVMREIVEMVLPQISSRSDKLAMIAKEYGWKGNVFGSGYGNGASLPKQAAGFDEAKLAGLLLFAVFAAGWGPHGHEDVLEYLDIDADKTRETIIAERRAAQANARMKAKLAKASPLVKAKKAAKGKKK